MPIAEKRTIRFDDFELDLRSGEVSKLGQKLKLQGQPVQILSILLEKPGELVTRKEIHERLWAADTFVDFEHSLNTAIKKLRQALGDEADTPRYVETLPRRGYRFIGQLVQDESDEQSAAVIPAPSAVADVPAVPPIKGGWWKNRKRVAAIAVGAVLLLGLVAGSVWKITSRTVKIESIAVLPLTNFSGDSEQEYFADGITEELITDLSKIKALKVISRTSVMRYKGTTKSLPEIGRELGVDAIVEGSVQRSGGRVRVTAQLVHAGTDRHVWAQTYERDLKDVLELRTITIAMK